MAGPSDQKHSVGTLPQAERRDFSGVDYHEAMRRAREIVPILRERAQEAEDARMLIRDERAAPARDRAVPLSPAEGVRRDGARVRGPCRHRGGARARLSVDRLERRQPRLPSLDPRLLRARNPARSVGRQPGRADRLLDRARRRPRAQGRGRVHRQRPLAVLLRRGQFGMEHARRVRSMATTARPPIDWRLCLVPKSDYEIIDTWYAMGMAATGQQGHRGHRTVRARAAGAGAPALPRRARASGRRAQHRARSTGIPIVAASGHPLAPAAVGAAEGAYELFLAVDGQAQPAPIPARGSRISRPCKSRWHGHAV